MLTEMTITDAVEGLRQKKFSAEELTRDHLKAVGQLNSRINAYITVTEEVALGQARAADEKLASGNAPVLTGIPLALKDFLYKGHSNNRRQPYFGKFCSTL